MVLTSKAKRGLIAFAIFDVAVIVALVFLYSLKSERDSTAELRELGVTVYPDIRPVQQFNLVDETMSTYTNTDLDGHWTMLFFGFTSCPDICPLTMAELKKFYEQLNDTAIKDDLEIVMVSVDPERDDPEAIGNYVDRFNERFTGVTGEFSEIAHMASQFFVAYSEPLHEHDSEKNSHEMSGSNYLIEHSGHIAVVDSFGNFHAVMRPPHRARDLVKAYTMIRDNAR